MVIPLSVPGKPVSEMVIDDRCDFIGNWHDNIGKILMKKEALWKQY